MATFVLYALLVNAALYNAFSNGKLADNSELWFGVRFRIMDDPICYELKAISIGTGTSVKCYTPKSIFPSQSISRATFQQDNPRLPAAKTA